MSITNATAAKRITMVSAARTAMAPCSSFSRSLMLLPSGDWPSHSPSNLDSDCEWRFIVVPRPGTKEPIGVIML